MTATTDLKQWWLLRDGAAQGPYTAAYIQLGLRTGTIQLGSPACPSGGQQWKPLREWPAFSNGSQAPIPPHSAERSSELPEFAKWIRYYCLFASPVLFFVGTLSCLSGGTMFVPESPLFGLEVLALGVITLVQLIAAVVLIFGAIGLPKRNKLSIRLLQLGFTVDLLNAFATLAIVLFLFALGSAEEGHFAQMNDSVFDLLAPVQLAALVFEAVALVWLVLRSDQLVQS